jgi:hypothetical protein
VGDRLETRWMEPEFDCAVAGGGAVVFEVGCGGELREG